MRYILEDTTLRFRFNTRQFSTGAPFTLAGTPSLSVYPEDSDTQITAGITLTVDNDTRTGFNNVVIDLTGSASYTADRAYQVVIEAGTVDGVSVVNAVVYDFFIVAAGGLEDVITRGLLALPAVAAGEANGLTIAGSNAATTFASVTCTGALTVSDGIVVTCSTANRVGLKITGNGSGQGAYLIGGSSGNGLELNGTGIGYGLSSSGGATGGIGAYFSAGTNGTGVYVNGNGSGSGLTLNAGGTGVGLVIQGGNTSGNGVNITTTSGHGINVAPVGTSKHGLIITGGNGGTSDGVNLVAGTGGVGLRTASITNTGALIQTGTSTFTGAITATSASNDIRGVLLAATGSVAMTEAYAADGAAPTLAQFNYMVWSLLAERTRVTTTLTSGKLDGTAAMTFTLDSDTAPTSQTRAT